MLSELLVIYATVFIYFFSFFFLFGAVLFGSYHLAYILFTTRVLYTVAD